MASRKFMDRFITTKEAMTHSHGAADQHAHEALAFAIWLDLTLATRQAEAVASAMTRKRPQLREAFQRNYAALARDLAALDQDFQSIVSQKSSMPLIVSHPVYDYFVRRYGLNIVSVHWEPDQIPDNAQWSALKSVLVQHPAKWMIWEGPPILTSVKRQRRSGSIASSLNRAAMCRCKVIS